jgi:glycosyltransferase involved in cell wall biosynthesis
VKISILSQVPPPVHGSTVMTQNFIRTLSSIGHSVSLIPRKFSLSNSDVGKFKFRKMISLVGLLARASRSLVFNRPSYFVAFLSSSTFGFLADYLVVSLARVLRIRVILYLHTVGFSQLSRTNRFFSYLVSSVFRTSDRAVVLCPSMVLDIEALIPKSRVSIIPNTTNFSPGVREQSKARKGKHQVLFLSNLIPSKGVLDFIEMAGHIAAKRSDCIFTIAGDTVDLEFDKKVQEKIGSLLGTCEIVTVGSVNELQKLKLYQESDVLVFPSYYPKEAQPMVVIEAFSMGLPVVAYEHGGLSDLIGDQKYVVKVRDTKSLASVVSSVLNSNEESSSIRGAVSARFESEYSTQSYTARWAEFLEVLGN